MKCLYYGWTGRKGQLNVNYTGTQIYNRVIVFVGSKTLRTYIEIFLVGSNVSINGFYLQKE